MQVRSRFEAAGGIVYEFTGLKGVEVHPNGVVLQLDSAGGGSAGSISGRLLLDCMGNFSPIVQQVPGPQALSRVLCVSFL